MQKPFVALQLYTIRDVACENPSRALSSVKEMGYDYVELAGIYDLSFLKMRNLLDEIGLVPISAHVEYAALCEDLSGTLAAYKGLGSKYIVIPMLQDENLPGGNSYDETRSFLKGFCLACAKEELVPVYHNHAHEFAKTPKGAFKLDTLFSDVPRLNAQIDTGWVKSAGQSPEAYIKKYAGRCPVIHLKDTSVTSYCGYEDRPVGKGSQDIPGTIAVGITSGAAGFIVELDKAVDQTSMDAAKESREYLKTLGY